jgi:hypothetical protein
MDKEGTALQLMAPWSTICCELSIIRRQIRLTIGPGDAQNQPLSAAYVPEAHPSCRSAELRAQSCKHCFA